MIPSKKKDEIYEDKQTFKSSSGCRNADDNSMWIW